MVMIGHARLFGLPSIQNYGVEIFFVLSGFLITALLLEEHERTGRLALRHFYARRVRRLLPALLVFMAVLLLVAHTTHLFAVGDVHRGTAFGLFYSANIAELLHRRLGVMSPLWSLAVEEHFYLVFPIVLAGLLGGGGRRRSRLRVALFVVLAGM